MNQFNKPLLLAMGLAAFACAPVVLAQPYAYVPNYTGNSVTVLDTATNTIATSIPVGINPGGVAVNGSGSFAYIANRGSNTVSVIDTATNTVVSTVAVGSAPAGIAVSADGLKAYVANYSSNNVSVLDTTTNTVVATIAVGSRPQGIASTPSGDHVFVANLFSDNVSVIDTASDTVTATVAVGDGPVGVDVDPSGTSVYVGNSLGNTVSVIATSGNIVTDTIPVGTGPYGVAVNPSGSLAYVSNFGSSSVSVIATSTKAVTATFPVVGGPRGISFNAAGTFAYTGTQSNTRIAVINTTTNAIATSIVAGSPRPLGQSLSQPLFGDGSIGAGHFHSCRVRSDSSADCWGRDDFGQATPPAGSFSTIVGGSAHSCGLKTDGTVTCWGNNDFGQATAPAGFFTQITAGFRHTCGVRPNGSAECWGDNAQGQATAPAGTFAQVSGGSSHSCGILTSGSAICWGRNVEGQSTAPAGSFIQLALGASFSCGLQSNGAAACWGDNTDGRATPLGGSFTQLAAEANYVCGLRNNGDINCWGTNANGQTTSPAGSFAQIATGRTSACALNQDGVIECWGDNFYAQAPQMDVAPALLPAGEVAQPYSATLTFEQTNPSFRPPYAAVSPVILVDGTLPPGLSIDNAGNITGTPTTQGNYSFTVIAEDANGFAAQRVMSIAVSQSAPVITPVITGTMGNNGWYVGNVTVAWTVVDPQTPVTSTSGCGTSVQSVNTIGTNFTCSATSAGGSSSVTVTIKLDKTRPTLVPTISNVKPLINDATVVATPNGGDATSGLATASCQVVDTSSVGAKSITCTATDVAGNVYTRTVAYRVIYGFVGFTGDVVNPGSWNAAGTNQLVDFDYRIVDANGAGVTGVGVPTLIPTVQTCPSNVGTIANPTTPSASPAGVQDLGNGYYRYTWQAPNTVGCQRLNIDLGDAQTNNRALFSITP